MNLPALLSPWLTVGSLVALLNAIICSGIAWACICRSTKTSIRTTRPAMRYLYPVAGSAALAAGFAWPWLGPWPHLALMASYLASMWLTSRAWLSGPPPIARKE
jgi:hypothetical protein